MLLWIAHTSTRNPRKVLGAAALIAILGAIFGSTVAGHMKSGGFNTADSESAKAATLINTHFGAAQPNFVVLISNKQGLPVNDPRMTTVGKHVAGTVSPGYPGVVASTSTWTAPFDLSQALRSKDGTKGLVLARISGDETEAQRTAAALAEKIAGDYDGIAVQVAGEAAVYDAVNRQITKDLTIAEAVALPISAVVLVLVFGSLIAASLPLLIGIFAIVGTLAILRGFTLFTDVSIFALNLTTAIGLALAIDYSLFIVSRYREELAAGRDTEAAIVRAIQTAGRTVLFSALTVALSLVGLAVFEQYFLRSFAYAGIAVVILAAAAALLLLPALLILLGGRVNALDLRAALRRMLNRPAKQKPPIAESFWYRWTSGVMRRPVTLALVIVALLLWLGSPFLGVKFGYPDTRVLPPSADARQVGDTLRTDFPANPGSGIAVVLPGNDGNEESIGNYARGLSKVTGVQAVLSSAGTMIQGERRAGAPDGMHNQAGTFLTVQTSLDPFSSAGVAQIDQLRAVPAPGPVLLGGPAIENIDALDSLTERLPLAAVIIVLTTLIVLFLFTGSVLLPVKALVLNILSLSASFGAMVWIFQDGHFSGLLGFTPTGYLVPTMPILMFCIAFGMSMDYEVFLLSRTREEWLASGQTAADNTHAVAMGIARTGRIFTAAALLMAIVISAMISSKVSFIQLMGLGLTLAVIADATVVRGVLVPALMRLMGTWNWWAPKPLAALHRKIGLEEGAPEKSVPSPVREPEPAR